MEILQKHSQCGGCLVCPFSLNYKNRAQHPLSNFGPFASVKFQNFFFIFQGQNTQRPLKLNTGGLSLLLHHLRVVFFFSSSSFWKNLICLCWLVCDVQILLHNEGHRALLQYPGRLVREVLQWPPWLKSVSHISICCGFSHLHIWPLS